MKKQYLTLAITLLVLGGGGLALYNSQRDDKQATSTTTSQTMQAESETSKGQEKTSETVSSGTYITLAQYKADPAKYTSTKKVHFFHASWCPICQAIHKEIEANPSKIPAGTTIIKTDFDQENDLRAKFGVTTQYTFVQIDNDGNEVAQWTASSLNKAIAGIKS